MANKKELALLKDSVAKFNAWRADHPTVIPDLTNADLTDFDLSGANLCNADLRNTILRRTNLAGADLTATVFDARLDKSTAKALIKTLLCQVKEDTRRVLNLDELGTSVLTPQANRASRGVTTNGTGLYAKAKMRRRFTLVQIVKSRFVHRPFRRCDLGKSRFLVNVDATWVAKEFEFGDT